MAAQKGRLQLHVHNKTHVGCCSWSRVERMLQNVSVNATPARDCRKLMPRTGQRVLPQVQMLQGAESSNLSRNGSFSRHDSKLTFNKATGGARLQFNILLFCSGMGTAGIVTSRAAAHWHSTSPRVWRTRQLIRTEEQVFQPKQLSKLSRNGPCSDIQGQERVSGIAEHEQNKMRNTFTS